MSPIIAAILSCNFQQARLSTFAARAARSLQLFEGLKHLRARQGVGLVAQEPLAHSFTLCARHSPISSPPIVPCKIRLAHSHGWSLVVHLLLDDSRIAIF